VKVLFLAAEASPLSKVGGLGDVAGELPLALGRLGLDVCTAVPLHASSDASQLTVERTLHLSIPRGENTIPVEVHIARSPDDARYWLVDAEPIRSAPTIYSDPAQDGEKFTLFCRAVLSACEGSGWIPQILHANDWHTVPSVLWARHLRSASPEWAAVRSVLTIHNLAYMGAGSEGALDAYAVPMPEAADLPGWSRRIPLPLGLVAADGLTTVSPSYAAEIRTAELGCGLDGVLSARDDRLQGILNGIDPAVWDPATDAHLAYRYSAGRPSGRTENKPSLQQELGLSQRPDVALLAMVTRMDFQKGVDLALQALPAMLDRPWQFVLLGTGDEALEAGARALAAAHPERVRVVQRFDAGLSRRIYAGSDLMLIPSRSEPCGLTQLIALRYGSIPVVRATGGLRDSITPFAGQSGTGFVFEAAEAGALEHALRQALSAFADSESWSNLQARAMAQDFGWDHSAAAYLDFYRRTISAA
jgi:starch synthase